jgi:hypothetical protein
MYYDATSTPTGGNHVVLYRTSADLLHWSASRVAFLDPSTGTGAGPTESPYVVALNGGYYLLIGPRGGYVGTDVFFSTDPLHFDPSQLVGHIASHAAEVVRDVDGSWYVSAAGWEQGGVHLAPLDWGSGTCFSIQQPGYTAWVETSPTARLLSLTGPDPTDGGTPIELLGRTPRGTYPYMGIGSFGTTTQPGAAANVAVGEGGDKLTLTGIPLGASGVTVDWTFCFGRTTFDHHLDWQVGRPQTDVWETAWSLDTTYSSLVDDAGHSAGDNPGFPGWMMGTNGSTTIAAAYASGSAWQETNHWLSGTGAASWQSVWKSGGTPWPAGAYSGGTWRVGISQAPNDSAYARTLFTQLNQATPTCRP